MNKWVAAFFDACFPPTCPMCDGLHTPTLMMPVCSACQGAMQWLGHPVLTAHVSQPAWASVRAACRFDGPIVDAVHRLKYQRRPDLAPALGRLLIECAFATSPHDVVIPVPLAVCRLQQRGYNQAQLLARPIARALHARLLPLGLRRVRETPTQVGLQPKARRENVRGAFAVERSHYAWIDDRRCVLIDDVMTTGATLDACAKVLRKAGARQVHALVLAAASS